MPPDRLFLLNTAKLALGDEPALAAHSAQDPALGYFLSKTAQQLILRFIRTQINLCQPIHLLSLISCNPGLFGARQDACAYTQKNPACVRGGSRAKQKLTQNIRCFSSTSVSSLLFACHPIVNSLEQEQTRDAVLLYLIL